MGYVGIVTWAAVPFALVTLVLLYCRADYAQLSQFKGPPLASVSRCYLFWQELNGRLPKSQLAALKKYGSPARMGPDLLVTNDADLVRHMHAPGSKWTRSGWYEGMKMDPRTDSVFSTRNEKLHADMKSKEAGGYNGRDIDTLESDMDARILDLIDLIKTKYHKSSMDIAQISRFFTLDVLSTIAFGAPFGFMANNKDLWDYNKEASNFLLILSLVTNHKFARWIFFQPWLQALAAPKDTDKIGMGPMMGFAKKHVAERFGPDRKVKNDMLGHFVKKGLSQVQCEVEAELQIIAGADSTSSVIRNTMFMIITTPVAYGKLKTEVDANAGNMAYPIVTYREAEKLPYLVACLWEGLRMCPPLFGMKGKMSPPGGETFKGVFYPEGLEMSLCYEAMCRNEEIFGKDAHIFRPERWIEADDETLKKYHNTVDAIFGSGRFLCLGKHIAMTELHKTFVELFRKFDWAIVDPTRGVENIDHGIHCQMNMNVVAYPRE